MIFTMSFSQSFATTQVNKTNLTEIGENQNIKKIDSKEDIVESTDDSNLEEVQQNEDKDADNQNENSDDSLEEIIEDVAKDKEEIVAELKQDISLTHEYQLKDTTITITVNRDKEVTEPDTLQYQYVINDEATEWSESNIYTAKNLIPNTEYAVKILVKSQDQIVYQTEDTVTTHCQVPTIQLEENDQGKLIMKLIDQNPINTNYKIMCGDNGYIDANGNIVEEMTRITLDSKEIALRNLENKAYVFKAHAINSNNQETVWSEEVISNRSDLKENVTTIDKTTGDVIIHKFDFETFDPAYTWNLDGEPKKGDHSIRLVGSDTYTFPTSTAGYENIEVSFYISTKGLNPGELCNVRWFDGLSWNIMARLDNSWDEFQELICLLPKWAANNTDFKIKFEIAGNELSSCIIDDITVRQLEEWPFPKSNSKSNSLTKRDSLTLTTRSDLENNYNNKIYPKSMYDLGDEMPFFSIGDSVDENINPVTGNVQLSYNDIVLKGKNGLDFILTRYYSQSQANIVSNLVEDRGGYLAEERNFITFNDRTYNIGAGWAFDLPSLEINGYPTLHYGRRGTFIPEGYVMAIDRYVFESYKLDDVVLSVDWDRNMFNNGQDNSAYYLSEPNGNIYYFNTEGRLIGKVDRYGNAIKFYHTQLTNEFNTPYWVLSKIIDSCNREIRFYYQYSSNKISIQVNDGQNTNTIQYNLAQVINETSERFGNYMPQSEIVLKSVVDMENNITTYEYKYESIRASMIESNINNAEKNIYVNLESAYYPTGARNFYWYSKYEKKDFGSTGRREYFRVQIERDILKDDCGSGRFFNTKTYGYTINPYADIVDTTVYYQGNYGKETYAYSYGHVNSMTFEGNDHKTTETYTYDNNDLLKKKKVSTYNTKTSDIMERNYDYNYNLKGQLLNIWDEQAARDSSQQLVNPSTDKHQINHTYHAKYNFTILSEYWQDDNTKIKIEKKVPTPDDKSVEWIKTYVNDTLKEKKQFLYDSYGNVIEIRIYLENNNFSNYTSQKFSYQDNRSRNAFNGTYLTKKWIDNIKDIQGNLIQPLAGNSSGTLDELYYYDNVGNLIEYRDGEGNSTTYTYDKIHRKTQQTNADGSTIKWKHTVNTTENSLLKTDENSNQIKYNYDGIGKLINVVDLTANKKN